MGYKDIYNRRLNRYGENLQDRVQGKREREFEDRLVNSLYLVKFTYDCEEYAGSLERLKQDESQTLQKLLVKRNLDIPAGTLLEINETFWLVLFLEQIQARGYNKYILLRMTHSLELEDDEKEYPCFFIGPRKGARKDTAYSSEANSIYLADENLNTIIVPGSMSFKKNDYIEVSAQGFDGVQEEFTVSGTDVLSTPGVQYVYLENSFKKYETVIEDDPSKEEVPENPSGSSFWTQNIGGNG